MAVFIGNIDDSYIPESIRTAMGKDTKKYGIKFDGTNSAGIRTYDAADLHWVVSSGTTEGRDDFATASDIFKPKLCLTKYNSTTKQREVMAYEGDTNWATAVASGEGDYMREYIPFYYRRVSENEMIVSPDPSPGFQIYPMFYHGGTLYPHVRVTAYNIGTGYVSKPGVGTLNNVNMNTIRQNLRAKGLYMCDYPTWTGISWLGLIKTGNMNVQATVGYGRAEGNATIATGGADTVKGLDGSATGLGVNESVKFMGIENFYSNCWKFLDGIYTYNNYIYMKDIIEVDTNAYPASVTDLSLFTKLATPVPSMSASTIRSIAFVSDCDYGFYPIAVGSPSPSDDCEWSATALDLVRVGGSAWDGSRGGLFAWASDSAVGYTDVVCGALGVEFSNS